MYSNTTIARLHQNDAQARAAIERNEQNGVYDKAEERFAADVIEAQKRLAEGRLAV